MKAFPAPVAIDASGMRVALVAARFNDEVVEPLLEGARDALICAGARPGDLESHRVPGAFELPLAASLLARTGRFDGVVALGAVIRGQTPHFDYVCAECARGLLDVQLAHELPVGFGVITADDAGQAMARAGGAMGNKGHEAAQAVLEMIALSRALRI